MQSQEKIVDQGYGLDISELVLGIQLLSWLKSFFQRQHLHLKTFEIVWVATHYSILLIYSAMNIPS